MLVTGGVPGSTVLSVPLVKVLITTLLVTNSADSVAPVILPPSGADGEIDRMISQVPVVPLGAAVVILALLAMLTFAEEVSITPLSPPLGALASSVPETLTVPSCISPISLMVPL